MHGPKEKKKYTAFLTVEHLVGAAALRPPLAALPLTAAAYPLRVLGGPAPATAMLPITRPPETAMLPGPAPFIGSSFDRTPCRADNLSAVPRRGIAPVERLLFVNFFRGFPISFAFL